MSYKSIVLDYQPKTKKMAEALEVIANEQEKHGFELVTFSISNSGKGIAVFKGEKKSTKIIQGGVE